MHHCLLRSWLYRHLLVLKWRCSLRWAAVDFSGRSECFFWGGAHSHCKCVCLCESTAMPRLMLSLTAIPATHTFFKNCIWYQYTVCEQWWSNNVPDNYCSAAAIKRFGVFLFCVICILYLCICPTETWDLEFNIILIHKWAEGLVVCQVGLRPSNENHLRFFSTREAQCN